MNNETTDCLIALMKTMDATQASHLRSMQSLRAEHVALREEFEQTHARLIDTLERAVQLLEGGS